MSMEMDDIFAGIEDYIKGLELRVEAGRQAIELLRDMKMGKGDGSPRFPGDHGFIPEKAQTVVRVCKHCGYISEKDPTIYGCFRCNSNDFRIEDL